MSNNTTSNVQIIGMIGVTQEGPENAGASLSVFGGGINPGGELPAGVDPDYIVEFALSHERAGFDMVLTGYSSTTPDGFEIAGYAAAHTRTLGYLIAHRPGFISPTLAARKIATLDQLTQGRVALHIISGGSDAEQQQDGDWLDHDSRYRRTDEYMTVLKNMWLKNEASDFEGEFYSYKGAHCKVTCYQKPHVPLFFGGASEIAARIGSRQADYYAFLGEPLGVITDRLNVLKEQAKQCDNHIKFSISFRPILGATEEEAWSKAFSILERVKKSTDGKILPGQTSRAQSTLSQRLVNFSTDKDIYDERLWMPIAYASGGAGNTTCLVGTPEQVVDSLMKYYTVGCTAFILRGFDPLNDAKEYGKQLIPLLRERVDSYNSVS